MVLKRHHKWLIGSGSALMIIFMIIISVFTYMIFVKQELNYNLMDKKLTDLKIETQTNINSLSEGLVQLKGEFGVIGEEFDLLKASVGEDFSGIIDNVIPSVVTIRTDSSQATGFIINEDGYIVTNAHVVTGSNLIDAITYEQDTVEAQLIGYDTIIDIALLKISGTYNALELENSGNVQVGEKVIAIGNPYGFQFSVSEGIVSAVHREGPTGFEAYIQTDAALNRGNSGGPLINKKGEVIGINNFKVGGSESLGFALESNFIKEAVNNIYQETVGGNLI